MTTVEPDGGNLLVAIWGAPVGKLAGATRPPVARIHDSQITLTGLVGRIRLHFLPPYCPNDNRIERYWKDLHANVTRNHTCRSIESFMTKVCDYPRQRNRDPIE